MKVRKTVGRGVLLGVVVLLLAAGTLMAGDWKLPELVPAYRYGNLLLDRLATKKKAKPVSFSHWNHRRHFACRVCHTELGFTMKAGTTPITEAAIRKGEYCGACHNGAVAFKVEGNCERCHNGNIDANRSRFISLAGLPRSGYADVIDWVKAEDAGLIKPRGWLASKSRDIPFDREFQLKAEWNMVPPAIFSHKIHTRQLDCSNCHPELFNPKKKGTEEFSMTSMLRGEFCGACHLSVAFPLHHCKRCHPGITMW
jgi:c(7)-type cytochrome triheme protein